MLVYVKCWANNCFAVDYEDFINYTKESVQTFYPQTENLFDNRESFYVPSESVVFEVVA